MKGFPSDIEKLREEIATRDKLDSEREVSPLKKAVDAIEILSTTSLSIQEVAESIMFFNRREEKMKLDFYTFGKNVVKGVLMPTL